MPLRIISGNSGQGKTTHILEEVIRLSKENTKQKYYIIVPEQFSLEMQRKLMEIHPDHGYSNIDVLSFYRLAYRVFDECNFQPKDILEDLGVSLMLKKILAEHEEELSFFKRTLKKPGFVDELKSVLMEFICYDVTWEQVQNMEEKLEEYPGLQCKCRELGKIFEYFDKEISSRFMVAEQILDVLSEMMSSSSMLREGVFYFDGFTGFTPVQLKCIRQLLRMNEMVTIAVTMEENTEEELFSFSKKTIRSLAGICRDEGVEMREETVGQGKTPVRFHNREMAFLERNLFRSAPETFEEEVSHLHLTFCRNPDEEAEYILHKIEQMVRTQGYRYKDFAVLTGNVEEYASAFRRKANVLQIPLFEDTKKRVSYHSGIETLRALFHLAVMDYSYESVFRYLKSGMSDMKDEDTDLLENYVIWAGIRGYSMWKNPFVRRMNIIEKEKGEYLQHLRQNFLDETEECVGILKDKKQNVRAKLEAVYLAMCRLRYPQKLEELADAAEAEENYVKEKEYRQLFTLLLELLDKIVGIFGDECLPVNELAEIMDAGLDALELGTLPLSMDQLILGDLKRTRLPDIQVLFVAGVNEGKIPPVLEDRGIINDDEKQILEQQGITLSLPLLEQSLEDEFYMYLSFTKPAREVYLTYAGQDSDGTALRPSALLKDCIRLFPRLSSRNYPEEEKRYYFNAEDSKELLLAGLQKCRESLPESLAFRMLLRYWHEKEELRPRLLEFWNQNSVRARQEVLPPEIVQELFGQELMGSVTRLERFAACPYQYYCLYGLMLEERQEYKVRAMDLGSLFHHALESFSQRIKESEYSWKTIPENIADEWVQEAVEKAAGDNIKDIFQSSARNQYKLQVIDRILKRTVKILKLHLQNSQMEPDRFELHFGRTDKLEAVHLPLKNGKHMRLDGFIDRVDICEEEDRILLRIIDYKSGAQSFDMNDLYHGLQMQLVIYMNVASEIYRKETGRETVPAGMFYYGLKDPIIKAEEGEQENPGKYFRMSGYANSEPDILEKLEAGAENFVSAPIRMTKKGLPYKSSPVMDTEDFQRIGRYTEKKIIEMGEAVYEGEIRAKPYKNDKGTACDYCPYTAVCGFDARLEEYSYREFQKESAQEILERIRKQVD